MSEKLRQMLENQQNIFVQQVKEWAEILVNFETRNKYEILDHTGNKIGFIAERNKGFFAAIIRQILNTHRPMEIKVWNAEREEVMSLKRPFYWFWSDLQVSSEGCIVGHIHRRFAFFHKVYDLRDERGRDFARIKSPFWRLWTFPIYDLLGKKIGVVSKDWGGMLKEFFTDADKFKIDFPDYNFEQKALVFAAAISVDLDYFEKNSKNISTGIFRD